MKHCFKWTLLLLLLMLLHTPTGFARAMYPETLQDGDLVLVDGHMGARRYADLSSVAVQQDASPEYRIAINVVTIRFSEDYYQEYRTYAGSPYTIRKTEQYTFRYDWDSKTIWRYDERTGKWNLWDIDRDHSHADGLPLIPYTAEAAFVAAYNTRFFDDTTGYSPKREKYFRVIDESFYDRLGI